MTLRIEYVSIEDLIAAPRNPKAHDIGLLHTLINKFGYADPMLLDERTGRLIAGHGRVETLLQQYSSALEPPEHVEVRSDGRWYAPVVRGWSSRSDGDAEAFLVGHNRSVESGGWEDDQLVEVLRDSVETGTLEFTGYDEADLENLIRQLDEELDTDPSGVEKGKIPNPRELPLDVIYSLMGADCTCCLAVQAGLKYGIQSSGFRLCPYTYELSGRHEVTFVDNNYSDYDHERHLSVVKRFQPKYATVRDVMTPGQCKDAGIEYYQTQQILEWAEELSEYAENVIVIPKHDCIDSIPDKFMLGYSIPSEYGGTQLPASMFEGRKVHLLGGSWKAQLDYLAALGDDVVSVDNNYIRRVAVNFARAFMPDGDTVSLADISLGHVRNSTYVALAITFGSIASKVNEIMSGGVEE